MWRKRKPLAANDKQKRRRDHVTASFLSKRAFNKPSSVPLAW